MPTSPLIDACDEIVTAINSHDWSDYVDEFTAAREYVPTKRLEDLASLNVSVCLPSRKREKVARGIHADTFRIVVGIQKQLDAGDKRNAADALMAFADALSEFVASRSWSFGAIRTIEEVPTIHGDRYDLDGVFTRAIALTFTARELIR